MVKIARNYYTKMDSNIRKLIHAASQDNDLSALTEAYGKLRRERQSSDDKIDAVSSDLFVLCAETAFKVYFFAFAFALCNKYLFHVWITVCSLLIPKYDHEQYLFIKLNHRLN